jgi:hypothetical protein
VLLVATDRTTMSATPNSSQTSTTVRMLHLLLLHHIVSAVHGVLVLVHTEVNCCLNLNHILLHNILIFHEVSRLEAPLSDLCLELWKWSIIENYLWLSSLVNT